eukprot:2330358-Rhodomonas_salina.1
MTGPFNGERQCGGGGGSGAQSLCGACARALASTSGPRDVNKKKTKKKKTRERQPFQFGQPNAVRRY